jgi:hypothetical protein
MGKIHSLYFPPSLIALPKNISKLLRSKPYETQVIILISALATLRVVVALAFDLIGTPRLTELLTDLGLFVLFAGLWVVSVRNTNVKSVHPLFGFCIILLLALNFIEFGGIHGFSRFNYYDGIFLIILLYNRWKLALLLTFQLLLLVVITMSTHLNADWIQIFTVYKSQESIDFFFSLIALGLLTFYLKIITENEINRFESFNVRLREKVRELRSTNIELARQEHTLRGVQENLKNEINRRTFSLEEQQKSIEAFTHMNTKVLRNPIADLNDALLKLPEDQKYGSLLSQSNQELQKVFGRIKLTLETNQELDRTKIVES